MIYNKPLFKRFYFMKNRNFIKLDNDLLSIDEISSVNYSKIETEYLVEITTKQNKTLIATELNAIEVLMQLNPASLEGKRLKWAKRVWYVHNLVGHPVMQILAMLKFYDAAFWVHDITVPKPMGFKKH